MSVALTPTSSSAQVLTLGRARITRVVESVGDLYLTPSQFLPGTDPHLWEEGGDWTDPHFLIAAGDSVHEHTHRVAMQTWVVQISSRTVLVDTAVGNDKDRPAVPPWSHLQTDFLARLAAAGVSPESADIVINTHLHPDHVGWNTVLKDGAWVPTFPNARYYLPAADVEFWDPANGHPSVLGPAADNMFQDSIAPVIAAGQAHPWSDRLRIDDNLVLEAAPGHTPGASVLRLTSDGQEALFLGDVLHSPVQLPTPDVSSCFCQDPAQAVLTRRRLFEQAARDRTLLFPAHFGGHGAFTVRVEGEAFAIDAWAPLAAE